jgi:N-ethylmaleimide reductase
MAREEIGMTVQGEDGVQSPTQPSATPAPHVDLFSPFEMQGMPLKNRVVMAALTRKRALNPQLAPTELMAEMYAQRSSAGLIVSEGTWVSPTGVGFMDAPGLFTSEQVAGWRKVTDAVHRKGGTIFAQISHPGAMTMTLNGERPAGASAVNPRPQPDRGQITPREMTSEEIRALVGDFATSAKNAKEAGFDGVQIQCNFVYVVAQFLHSAVNVRTDEYGGSSENRARLLFDILDATLTALGGSGVGLKVGPTTDAVGPMAANADTIPTFDYVLTKLNTYDLTHVLISGLAMDVSATPIASLAGDRILRHARQFFRGTLIANGDFNLARANQVIGAGMADLVAFGRPYISNPDLVQQFRDGLPLNPIDGATVYRGRTSPSDGYTDYPRASKS